MDPEKFLFSLSRFGVKLGLGPTRTFASHLGDPQTKYKIIHVGGSNGKGSTATFLSRVLDERYKTGLYTSPHLRRFNERIMVGNKEINDEYLDKFVKEHPDKISYNGETTQLTFFEYTTVMAFKYFLDVGVEYLVAEVGLGGRLDSTNIVTPEVSLITSISLEHSDKLGGEIENIAREKGGIIKRKKPVIIGKMPQKAKDVLAGMARENQSKIKFAEDCKISNLNYSLDGTSFSLETENEKYSLKLESLGEHQVNNSIMAILGYETAQVDIDKKRVERAIGTTTIPGRFEIRRKKPLVVVDGAHNSEAIRLLVSNIKRYNIQDPLIILGILKDKNSFNILQSLSEISDEIIVTEPNERYRKKNADELKKEALLFFKKVESKKEPSVALEVAMESGRNLVIAGSFYLAGDMELLLDDKENDGKLRMETIEPNGSK